MADRNPVQHSIPKPIFEGAMNGLMTCQGEKQDGSPCDWVFFGPRSKFQLAWTAHYRQAHSEEVGVVLTHGGGTRLGDLVAMQNRQPRIVIAH